MKQPDQLLSERNEDGISPTPREKAWAIVRIILGVGQMLGVVVSVYFLIETGVNA